MKVALRNKGAGEIKLQKIGWSWTCFLFGPFLGIPLFTRRLNVGGGIMVIIWSFNFITSDVSQYQNIYLLSVIVIFVLQIGFMIFFGVAANRMAGKNYLENGWESAEPISLAAETAREKWGLPQLRSALAAD